MTADAQEILDELYRANGRLLHPAEVLAAARPADSPLHGEFEWDDGAAAEQHRLWQARQLIRVYVTVVAGARQEYAVQPKYVSLRSDRANGGGYRELVDVLSDAEHREELLADAKRDMTAFRRKYQGLRELAEVFAAMDAMETAQAA